MNPTRRKTPGGWERLRSLRSFADDLDGPSPHKSTWTFESPGGKTAHVVARTEYYGRQEAAVELGVEPGQLRLLSAEELPVE